MYEFAFHSLPKLATIFISSFLVQSKLTHRHHRNNLSNIKRMSTLESFSTSTNKVIAIIRHGQTECNEYLHGHEWGRNDFKDPELWDTVLSQTGRKQASSLNNQILNSDDIKYKKLLQADLFVSSPLTRALTTTELAFKNISHFQSSSISKIVLPLAAERVYMSSDVGRPRDILEKEFPSWDFSQIPHKTSSWWYRNIHFNEASRTRTRNLNPKYYETTTSSSLSTSTNSPNKRMKKTSIEGGGGNMAGAGAAAGAITTMTEQELETVPTTTQASQNSVISDTVVEDAYTDTKEYIEWRSKGYYGNCTCNFTSIILSITYFQMSGILQCENPL